MVVLSITGAVRTILIVIAVFVILRFLGQLMSAKRNASEDQKHRDNINDYKKAKEESEKNKGKIHVIQGNQSDAEDVDYEEVKDDKNNDTENQGK